MTCAATRLISIAFAVGLVVSTLTGSDLLGWAAAGIAVALAWLAPRVIPSRVARSSCAVRSLPANTTESTMSSPVQ